MFTSPSKQKSLWEISKRCISSNEVAQALRPFLFLVHPDKYAKFPEIQTQNEKSLQIFNGYMNDLFPVSPSLKPTKVSFSIADKQSTTFRKININLTGTDPAKIVRDALESCELSTSELKFKDTGIRSTRTGSGGLGFTTSNVEEDLLRSYLKRKKATVITNLYDSLTNKRDEAMRKTREAKSLLVSIKDDISDLKYRTQLKDVVWQMAWEESHMRRCISNVNRMIDQATPETRTVIEKAFFKNVLRFGRGSFICCDGSIQLGADHVPEQWENVCQEYQIRKRQIPLLKETAKQLEQTFGGAQILLPHFKGLAQTLTQLQTLTVRVWKKEALLRRVEDSAKNSMLEIVTSYDELAIGLDGRLYIPCNVDVPSLVQFLEENSKKAIEINQQMHHLINELEFARDECIKELKLTGLRWEQAFTPEALIQCVYRLTHCSDDVRNLVSGLSIVISASPSIYVTSDGTLSIPLNWS
ncbi:T-cell activation inhibitor, mitochondrial [Caenorhabditis elegans]|nr:T-cell activation inhibitor, mitochondrial [Caenorhabditis elegans]CCD66771.1 T-cell activation inhibitor, mitochondrial [Caenorhabditis elegans]|eukprot:NP_001024442.1 Uncharacterized protein CELE_C35B8.3 [Caenorhabditis elegans]